MSDKRLGAYSALFLRVWRMHPDLNYGQIIEAMIRAISSSEVTEAISQYIDEEADYDGHCCQN